MKILRFAASALSILLSLILFLITFPVRTIWSKLTADTYIVYVIYTVTLTSYSHLLQTKQQWFADDINGGCYTCCVTLFTLYCIAEGHSAQVAQLVHKTQKYVDQFGRARCLLFLLTVSAASYLLVNMADTATTLVRDVTSGEIVRRFEDNIHRIKDDREEFQSTTIHPVTKGLYAPKLFHKFFRYPMEDVRMKCVHRMPWLSRAFPHKQQVVWHRNGVPLTFTDRHSIKVSFREIPEDNFLLDGTSRKYGISMYEINSTLTIHLLKSSEFGSYTCHVAKSVQNTMRDYIELMKKLNRPQFGNRDAVVDPEPAEPPFPQCSNAVERIIQWQDVYTWVGEFRVIKIRRRLEPIRIAPGAILSFTTSYWHLSWREDVEVDYSVNRKSYHELCPGKFHGCSKLLMMYWFLVDDTGWRFGGPPLHLFSIWKQPAERYHLLHCLCKHSYGHHAVKYLRGYYNRTTKNRELIEIQHPHALLVIPKEQQMLELFLNYSASSPVKTPLCCTDIQSEEDESSCAGFLINEMASFASDLFEHKEQLMLCLSCFLCVYAAVKLKLFFRCLCRFIRCLTLEGSMGCFVTAAMTFSIQSGSENEQSGTNTYDVFPSYCDAEVDTAVVNETVVPFLEFQGLKVFARNRDGHPAMPELHTISTALQNSRRFLIFLSKAYFGDRFRNDFEAAMIFETLSDRAAHPNEILLIKLDQCDTPLWLRQFPLQDWTASGLTAAEHQHQLLKWLEPAERKRTFRCGLDLLVSLFPVTAVATLLVAFSLF